MAARESLIKHWLERITGWHIERVGLRSFALVDPHSAADAWMAPHWQMRQVIETLGVDLVLDVGANEGRFGRQIRRIYHGEMHSFEPIGAACETLRGAASGDPLWHVHQMALGRNDSTQTLHVSANTVFASFLSSNTYGSERFKDEAATVRTEQVAVRRLDRVLRDTVPDIDRRRILLKTDTQGYDLEVFAGLGNMQSRIDALLAEVSLVPIYEGMPHWTDSLVTYEQAGLGVVGMIPVSWDRGRVVEYDCLMTRARSG